METLSNCPVCSSSHFSTHLSCVDYTVSRETFHVVQCKECGFRFTNPRPSATEIGKYYESEEYISHSGTSKGLINKIYGIVRNYTIGKKVELANRLRSGQDKKTLLDIGCGTGEFLNACKEAGWEVTGLEPSPIARKHAQENFGLMLQTPDQLKNLPEKNYSVITLWHVLEHVHELDETIQLISKALSNNGRLVIAVPNCNAADAKAYGAYWAAWDLPRHIYHFTENDIKRLFERHGFNLKEVLPMKFDSYYVSMLSEKYKSGGSGLIHGFWNGLKSNLSASGKDKGFSSQIYILAKK